MGRISLGSNRYFMWDCRWFHVSFHHFMWDISTYTCMFSFIRFILVCLRDMLFVCIKIKQKETSKGRYYYPWCVIGWKESKDTMTRTKTNRCKTLLDQLVPTIIITTGTINLASTPSYHDHPREPTKLPRSIITLRDSYHFSCDQKWENTLCRHLFSVLVVCVLKKNVEYILDR